MNLDKYKLIVCSVLAGSLLLAALFLLPAGTSQMARAAPKDLFVTSGGGGDCSQVAPCDLPTALGVATTGDTVYLAVGTYTATGAAVISVTKSITLYGGWDGAVTIPPARDPDANRTILDGERQRRVIFIGSGISPTVDGFTITGGNATGLGGGLLNPSDAGGGIYSHGADPLIQNNVITNNVASTQAGVRAFGGGIYIDNAPTAAIIRQDHILSNTAGIGIHLGDGGGIFFNGPIQVLSNTLRENTACVTCSGQGGGLEAGWTNANAGAVIAYNTFENNQAGDGGGMQIVWSAVEVSGNTLRGNRANSSGGGILAYYDMGSAISANRLISNTAIFGGGIDVRISLPSFTTLTNNVLARNRADVGGGVYAMSDWHIAAVTLTHNTLVDNGAGLLVGNHLTATLVNNIFVSHTLAISRTDSGSQVAVDHTLFWANVDDGLRGTMPVDGDPAFVAPAYDDYHIGPGSAAIDAGVDVGVLTDIDGDPRPAGPAPDIGADEREYSIYLPLVMANDP